MVTFVIGVALVACSGVEVTVSRQGVRARSSTLHRPSTSIPLDEVETASAVDLEPAGWGGWGYRGDLRLFKRTAWLPRRGHGLELQLTGGRRFAVAVDDADEAAAVLNGLVARRVQARQ
jgi:hypothetical protein